ncbi:hypothetical protein J6X15_02410 [Candidatus Saccharibacteria bacterium]|nr:hypothetical protein [Candidatus Saccharibacteria bacterium]
MSEMIVNSNNKIITRDVLLEIFEAMHNELETLKKAAADEKAKNEPLKTEYQKWTLRYFDGNLRFSIYFLDNHNVSYDDYHTFITLFKNQSFSIERIYVNYTVSYNKPGENNTYGEHMHNSLRLTIDEDKVEVTADLASGDHYLEDIYNMILQKISSAPPKFDRIIKAKELISFKIGLPIGLILGAVVTGATLFVPQLREFYHKMFFLFPILELLLGIVISIFIGAMRTSSDYAKLIPKKYGGYDSNTKSSYYNDDLKKLTETSEVLIGNKSNNLTIRNQIAAAEKRAIKQIPIGLGVVAAVCLVAFIITLQ